VDEGEWDELDDFFMDDQDEEALTEWEKELVAAEPVTVVKVEKAKVKRSYWPF
jgi:hypothetical protein